MKQVLKSGEVFIRRKLMSVLLSRAERQQLLQASPLWIRHTGRVPLPPAPALPTRGTSLGVCFGTPHVEVCSSPCVDGRHLPSLMLLIRPRRSYCSHMLLSLQQSARKTQACWPASYVVCLVMCTYNKGVQHIPHIFICDICLALSSQHHTQLDLCT